MKYKFGNYVLQPKGYKAFIPESLLKLDFKINPEIQKLLLQADRALAKLDGITITLPNPEPFITMYVKKEALLSSQIEGTQASLEGVLEFEANLVPDESIDDIKEVINYVNALNYGIERLKTLSMSLRLIKEIHKILLTGARGATKEPGEFRKSQNWIGPVGATLNEATFVPPPPHMILDLMGDLEKFIYQEDNIPHLMKIALIHNQFETIHPFLDGNGRVGRLLITLYLYWKDLLTQPLLYLSFYLKKHREKYYNLLMKSRTEGLLDEWIMFFLQGVHETSIEAIDTAKKIIELKEEILNKLYENSISSIYAVKFLDILFKQPLIDINTVISQLKIHKDTANELIKKFNKIGILREITGKQRYRKYIFTDYLMIIKKGTELIDN
jgi:Fic family protein